jgi:hypothetical protein
MPGKKGSPKSDFPQIRVKKGVYDALRDLRFALKKETINEVIEELLKKNKKK